LTLITVLLALHVCLNVKTRTDVFLDGRFLWKFDSCAVLNIPEGSHRLEFHPLGYRVVDTVVDERDSVMFLTLTPYIVDSVVVRSVRAYRPVISIEGDGLASQPVPLFHDPVYVAKSLPFVLPFPTDELGNYQNYYAALGKPEENLISIEGVPFPVMSVYPRPLIPLPLVGKMDFYLLNTPLDIGWTVSSQIDIQLPLGKRSRSLYFDPFGSFSYKLSDEKRCIGLQSFGLFPVFFAISRGRSRIFHLDSYFKNLFEKYALSGFLIGEVLSLTGDYEPERTYVSGGGLKFSLPMVNFILSFGMKRHIQPGSYERLRRVIITGVNLKWNVVHFRFNTVNLNLMEKSPLDTGFITNKHESFIILGRTWLDLNWKVLSLSPYLDLYHYNTQFSLFGGSEESGDSLIKSPGFKLSISLRNFLRMEAGISHQIYSPVKFDWWYDVFSRFPDMRETRWGILEMRYGEVRGLVFGRESDTLMGWGAMMDYSLRFSKKLNFQFTMWTMRSVQPDMNYGFNWDALLNGRLRRNLSVILRFPGRRMAGGNARIGEQNVSLTDYDRMDILLVWKFRLKGRKSHLFAGIYNIYGSSMGPESINFPIPTLALEINL